MSDLILTKENSYNSTLNNRLSDSLDYFLIEISGKIQLTATQKDKAVSHYEAIASVLKNSPEQTFLKQLDTQMIPFGGLGTNTASKPFKNDEFDLDIIIKFLTSTSTFRSAERLYLEVYNVLARHETYKNKLEQKDRCIRIYYSGEFHLDLMPAVLFATSSQESTKLFIPEKQGDGSFEFELVDPIGLMNWFEIKCNLQKESIIKNFSDRGDFETMPITTEDARKSVLKQAVQLIKRARDIYFYKDEDCKKILKSVVILTVAGETYWGENNLYKLVDDIVDKLDSITYSQLFMRLENPVNSDEDFLASLHEHQDRYEKLRQFILEFKRDWRKLSDSDLDLTARTTLLSKLFGENVTTSVFSDYAEKMEKMNTSGKMKMVSSGLIGVSTSNFTPKVPRHQFFGDK